MTSPAQISKTPPELAAAFRIFLNRAPAQRNSFGYSDHYELNRSLAESPEFLESTRAYKNVLGWPLSQVFISLPARVMYCPIGKNACTFLKTEVARSAQYELIDYMARDIHFLTDYVCTGLQLSDYTPERVSQLCDDSSFYKFAILRDPADRLLSAYIEKLVIGRTTPENIHHTKSVVVPIQKARGIEQPDFNLGITFRQFINHLAVADPKHLDPHWKPQVLYLQGINYDRFFRIDQLDELMDILEKRAGIQLNRKARNVTGSGSGIDVDGAMDLSPLEIAAQPKISRASFFDASLQQTVETFFADDYRLLQQT